MDKNPNVQPQPQLQPQSPPPAYSAAQPCTVTTAQPAVMTVTTAQPAVMTVTTAQPAVMTVTTSPLVGPQPSRTTCPSCNADMVTRVEYKPSMKTHIIAVLLCIACLPCVLIPYLVESCNNVNHYCTHCGRYVGTYAR